MLHNGVNVTSIADNVSQEQPQSDSEGLDLIKALSAYAVKFHCIFF